MRARFREVQIKGCLPDDVAFIVIDAIVGHGNDGNGPRTNQCHQSIFALFFHSSELRPKLYRDMSQTGKRMRHRRTYSKGNPAVIFTMTSSSTT